MSKQHHTGVGDNIGGDKNVTNIHFSQNIVVIQREGEDGKKYTERRTQSEFQQVFEESKNKILENYRKRIEDLEDKLESATENNNWFKKLFIKQEFDEKQLKAELAEVKQQFYIVCDEKSNLERQVREILEQLNGKDLKNNGLHYQRAVNSFAEGNIEDALLQLDDSILEEEEKEFRKHGKRLAEARLLKAKFHEINGNFDTSLENLEKAVDLFPSYVIRQTLAQFLFQQNRKEESFEIFQFLIFDLPDLMSEEIEESPEEVDFTYTTHLMSKTFYYCSLLVRGENEKVKLLELGIENNQVALEAGVDGALMLHLHMLTELGYAYGRAGNFEGVDEIISEADHLIVGQQNQLTVVVYLIFKGGHYRFSRKEEESFAQFEAAMKILDRAEQYPPLEVKRLRADIYISLSQLHLVENRLECCLGALTILEELTTYSLERFGYAYFRCLIQIGKLHFTRKEFKDSIFHLKKALNFYPKNELINSEYLHYDRIAKIYACLAENYFFSNKFSKALKNIDRSLKYYNKSIEVGQPVDYANEVFESLYKKTLFVLSNYKRQDRIKEARNALNSGLMIIIRNSPDSRKTKRNILRARKLAPFLNLNQTVFDHSVMLLRELDLELPEEELVKAMTVEIERFSSLSAREIENEMVKIDEEFLRLHSGIEDWAFEE